MAAAFDDRDASRIQVGEVAGRIPYCCREGDDVRSVLGALSDAQVRRMPVLDNDDRVTGVVSVNDIVLESKSRKRKGEISYADAIRTLKSICAHHQYPATTTSADHPS
jgi:signal-transduction protein with cAMP-binding, CBS, and nucleotidyltransferase domain